MIQPRVGKFRVCFQSTSDAPTLSTLITGSQFDPTRTRRCIGSSLGFGGCSVAVPWGNLQWNAVLRPSSPPMC